MSDFIAFAIFATPVILLTISFVVKLVIAIQEWHREGKQRH